MLWRNLWPDQLLLTVFQCSDKSEDFSFWVVAVVDVSCCSLYCVHRTLTVNTRELTRVDIWISWWPFVCYAGVQDFSIPTSWTKKPLICKVLLASVNLHLFYSSLFETRRRWKLALMLHRYLCRAKDWNIIDKSLNFALTTQLNTNSR